MKYDIKQANDVLKQANDIFVLFTYTLNIALNCLLLLVGIEEISLALAFIYMTIFSTSSEYVANTCAYIFD